MIDKTSLAERFMRYVQVDTQADPESKTFPSTEKQKNLSRMLLAELQADADPNAEMDDNGYVYATIPANTSKAHVPSITFLAHVDTAPDCSGANVKPRMIQKYSGEQITYPANATLSLNTTDSPYLNNCIGHDIITTSGDTLLGADDKSGIAIIMQAAEYLRAHPEVKHGLVRIVFTPDEEVGRGVEKIDMIKAGADFGYTLDGGEAGSLEDETFSADSATLTVHGVITHPGYAKDKLVNALKIAGEILAALPKDEWSPEATEKREGFVHPVSVGGIAEKAMIGFIVRDYTREGLTAHHARLRQIAEEVATKYPGASVTYAFAEQYRNMKEVLDKHPEVVAFAEKAIRKTGLTVQKENIRGGTDGSRLSFMGLPCPNIFTGMQNIHSLTEWISVDDMTKAVETVINLVQIAEAESA